MNDARPIPQARDPRLGEMGLENFPPYLMNRIMGRYNAALQEEMTALGLTTPQMRSLAVLSVIDGPLIRDLAVYAVVQPSTLSRALDALEKSGLIRRETDTTDSRATRVFLTEEGRQAYDRMWPLMATAYGEMFKGVEDAERQAFIATLQKILRNVRVHDF
ncbi:MarR family transcriptional regulator [Sulfitobacter sp. HNIBRBA3233]|uniref:MarR family winged helix-turn-helix transcriptional regulator n=1 Tax=Sulfitobacter marinivivus TaxID=3158558 RepID=UPI0032DFDED9